MALIECSECGRQVSDRAVSCPGCGAPIAGKAAGAPVQTIEKTAKKLKGQELLAGMVFWIGGIALIVNLIYAAEANSSVSPILVVVTALGLVWYMVVKLRIWWHHG